MRTAVLSSQLFFKSFGHGIFQARMVPSKLSATEHPHSNGDNIRAAEKLKERICKSGITIQEIVPDPEDPEVAYVLIREGRPPCKLEREQWDQDDLDHLSRAVEASTSVRFMERVGLLVNSAVGVPVTGARPKPSS